MKVLRVLGLIFGILLILAGGGLLAGSFVADQGQDVVQQEMEKQGLKGPVEGKVVAVNDRFVTVDYTDLGGRRQRAAAVVTSQGQPAVGDTVQIFYDAQDPTAAAVSDLSPIDQLSKISGTLRLAGIITLAVGGLLLIASILGFIFAKKKPKPAPVQAQPQPYVPEAYPNAPPAAVAAPQPDAAMPAPSQPAYPAAQAYTSQPYPPAQPEPYPPVQPQPQPQSPEPYPPVQPQPASVYPPVQSQPQSPYPAMQPQPQPQPPASQPPQWA